MPTPLDFEFRLAWLNPFTLARATWLQGRRGWSRLWRAPGPNARFFMGTTFFWSVAMALTDPYKALYLSKLGLSNLAIGGFFALDMGLRVFGVVAGGLVAQRWGHKRTLLVFDFISWVIPCAVLALATEPWHVYLATCLTATNALVAGSVVQLLVEDTPQDKRTPLFALFSLTFVLPMLLLPGVAGMAVQRWGVEPVMRALFGLSTVLTLWGVLWRRLRLKESVAVTPDADLGALLDDMLKAARHLLAQPGLWQVLGSFLLLNALANLNKAYYALYVTGPLGLKEGAVGWLSMAGAVAFVAGSLGWVPRLRHGQSQRLFFVASCANVLPILGLAFTHDLRVILGLAVLGGGVASVHGALMSERLASLLPAGREGLAQSLLSSLMQVAVALSLFLAGVLFETRFTAFPVLLGGLALLQAGLAWSLWKKVTG